MRIGSFYGFTVPMLITIYNDDLKNIISRFNVRLNQDAGIDMKKELWYFKNALNQIKPDVYLEYDNLKTYESKATVKNGEIVGSYCNEPNANEIHDEILGALVDQCAKRLYERIDDKALDLSGLDTENFTTIMFAKVENVLQGLSFQLSNINTLTRAFMKSLNSEESIGDKEQVKANIQKYCCLHERIPEDILLDNEHVKLSPDEQRVIAFYKERIDIIDSITDSIHVSRFSDDNMFGISFVDFLNRKPTSLYYMIIRYFDHLKNSDIKLFNSIFATVKEEYAKCREYINTRLLEKVELSDLITVDDFAANFPDESEDAINFIQDVYSELSLKEISLNDLKKLLILWYAANSLNISYLNEVWGTNFTVESLQSSITKLNKLGIGGINLFTKELFKEAVNSIIFIDSTHVEKSEEYLKELLQVCSDVEAFLSTFKPIGGEISV